MTPNLVTEPTSAFSLIFPPQTQFTGDDVPDMTGKVVLVTGGNSGIGKEICRALLARNARVYMASRSKEKAQVAMGELLTQFPDADLRYHELKLDSIRGAAASAKEFLERETSLHLLFNNAGVMCPPKGSKTSDGFELQWGTNVLGHYVFTETLVDLLAETAKTAPASSVRVVTTASLAESDAPPEGVNLQDQFLGGNVGTGGMTLYGQSKLGNIIISQDWAKRYANRGIMFSSLVSVFPCSVTMLYYVVLYAEKKHPGVLKAELQRDFNFAMRSMTLFGLLLQAAHKGSWTPLYAGTSPDVTLAQHSGAYFVPWARVGAPSLKAQSPELRQKVMTLIRRQISENL